MLLDDIPLKNFYSEDEDKSNQANQIGGPFSKEEKQTIIGKLAEQIRYHQQCYYNQQSEISDEEFDALWDRLRAIDVNHTIFEQVGQDGMRFFDKKMHLMPMGSLDKVTDEVQFETWMQAHESEYYVVQYKLDGASLELQYTEGILTAAVTRGNGKKGDDILINARKMQGVLRVLPQPLNIAVRGEVIMRHEIHKKYFSNKANCRNAANGLMKRKDGKFVEYLDVLCYDIWYTNFQIDNSFPSDKEKGKDDIQESTNTLNFNSSIDTFSELQKLDLLQTLGFNVVEFTTLNTIKEIDTFRSQIIKKRKNIGFDIDGLVIKMPISDIEDMKTLLPTKQIAYKFPLEIAQTKVLDIQWSESGHLYTPIGILEPVRIAGTIVKRANLVHPNHIQELGIGIGAEVLVVKRGEIIPKIEKVVVAASQEYSDFPTSCSTCGTLVKNIGTRIFCPNMRCRRRILFRIDRWCKLLELDFWGEKFLHRMVIEEKIIDKIGDLYRLDIVSLQQFDRIGEPLAKKLLANLHTKKQIPFSILLAALGIDGVAVLTAEKISAAGYPDWNTLKRADVDILAQIDSIGPVIANNVVEALAVLDEEVQDIMSCITITPTNTKQILPLSQYSFCFTGVLSTSRKEAQTLVKERGGVVKSSVSKDLSYLVTNNIESNSDKSKKARKFGVKIIKEQDFLDLVSK